MHHRRLGTLPGQQQLVGALHHLLQGSPHFFQAAFPFQGAAGSAVDDQFGLRHDEIGYLVRTVEDYILIFGYNIHPCICSIPGIPTQREREP